MCGICGVISTSLESARSLVSLMTPTMTHRGPDDEGYFESGPVAFGMRRLSIIDIEGGHQPIFNEDGSVAVLLNGEIYNYRELRDELWHLGHTFRTRADSEVVAHAYEEWGAECVQRLQGMFALAVFDCRYDFAGEQGSLFLARDRLGIKPLYYYQGTNSQQTCDQTQIIFASEVRTLLASNAIPRRLSRSAIESFLLFGSVSEPETLVEGIYSLPPGHRMTIRIGAGVTTRQPECYWNLGLAAAGNGDPQLSANQTKARVRELLEASVKRHLIADVPVGVFLSGGIDSTTLAALAARQESGVHTFTVGFPEQQFSEAQLAQRTATRLGTNHRAILLQSDDLLSGLKDAVAALDQPSIDGINTYFVSSTARQAGLKVALSGLGGDEVFGGYSTFKRTPHYQKIAAIGGRVPNSLRAAMSAAFTGATENVVAGDAARKIAALWNEPASLPDPYFFSRALFTPSQVTSLLKEDDNAGNNLRWWNWLSDSAEQARKLGPFTAVSCMEAQSYLVSTLLRDTDSMSMAHSLEVRVPLLDHELVEFVTKLPESAKLRKGVPKSLLIAAVEDLVPQEVVTQPKRGFTFPWAAWLKGPLKQIVAKGLAEFSDKLEEVLQVEEARDVWQNYLSGHTSWSRPWSLFVLNEWVKRNL